VVAAVPNHDNANKQLARLALEEKRGAEALGYLDRLPARTPRSSELALLRLSACYLAGHNAEADTILEGLSAGSRDDPRLGFSTGLALASAGQYDRAETFFSQALAVLPSDFEILYNLGLAAIHTGHYERARDVLDAARREQPDDGDVLYNLAVAELGRGQNETALVWLARATKLAPDRAAAQRLLAQTTSGLGYYADSAAAWGRYFALTPSDHLARRERGFTTALTGRRQDGLADLRWYIAKHPDDPIGHFETAIALTSSDRGEALLHLNRAIALKKDYTSAYYARGVLLSSENNPQAAVRDFELAARLEPENAPILDQLGRAYLAVDRAADALPFLRKAAELSPRDSKTLMHLGRALAETGQTEESRQVLARFRALGPGSTNGVPAAGFVDLLALPAEQQYERYRARVERALVSDPDDVSVKLRYLKLLLNEGEWDRAEQVARQMVALNPEAALLAEAGRAFLDAGQYAAARQVLERCPEAHGAALDLAVAVFHIGGPASALDLMERVPEAARSGDYYLARAQMLEGAGRFEDAVESVNQALRATPTRAELYSQVTILLIQHNHVRDALQLLEQAQRFVPDNPVILLTRAIALEVAGDNPRSDDLLREIERRWPEWPRTHLVRGIILQTHKKAEAALQELTTAQTLGVQEPSLYYSLAEALFLARPDDLDTAQQAVKEALAADPADPWAHSLAGRISSQRKDYANALQELQEAIRLRPQLVQAHYVLARVYKALGRSAEARETEEQARLLQERFPNEGDDPDLLHTNLFSVSVPRRR